MLTTSYRFGEVHPLAEQIAYTADKVDFKKIFENNNGGVSLLAFKAGQELPTHIAPAEVMIYVIDGEIELTMIDKPHTIHSGEFILMGNDVPHSVKANHDSRVALIKIKP